MYEKATAEWYRESADYLSKRLGGSPQLALVLGSGLDRITEKMSGRTVIPYREIPHFPVSTVSYQKGEMVFGLLGGKRVLVMNGRFHYYEGWEMWQTAYPVGVLKLLGVERLVLTNAAGGIAEDLVPGSFVLLHDHIKLAPDSPLRGANLPEFGVRFPDMQRVYDREFLALAEEIAAQAHISARRGVYAYMSGPQYETPAEIRALRVLGADVVGMSTVAEVIAAAHCGIRTLCISCVSNKAAGMTGEPLTEREVLETAARIADGFETLLLKFIERV